MEHTYVDDEIHKAKAKLMDAAPQLLEALEQARADLRDYGAAPIQQVRDNITAVIKAATA